MSPEELKELEELEAMEANGAFEGLSASEDAELQALEAEVGDNVVPMTNKVEPGVAAAAQTESSFADKALDLGESALTSVADTALAFGSDIPLTQGLSALVGTGVDYATGREGSSFGDTFANNQQNVEASVIQGNKRTPKGSFGGRLTSEMLQFGIPAAKLAKLGKLKNLAKMFPKATALATNLAADFGVGTVKNFSETDTNTLETVLESAEEAGSDAITGLMFGTALSKGFSMAGPKLGQYIIDPIERQLTKLQLKAGTEAVLGDIKILAKDNDLNIKQLLNRIKKHGIASQGAVDGNIASDMIHKGGNAFNIAEGIGRKINDTYTKLAKTAPKMQGRDTVNMIDEMMEDMATKFGGNGLDPAIIRKLNKIKGRFMDIPPIGKDGTQALPIYHEMDVKQYWNTINDIDKITPKGAFASTKKQVLNRMREGLKVNIETIAEKGGDDGAKMLKELAENNKDYGIFKDLKDITDRGDMALGHKGLMGNFVKEFTNGKLFLGGAVGGAAIGGAFTAGVGMSSLPVIIGGAGIYAGAKALATSPQILLNMNRGLGALSNGALQNKLMKYSAVGGFIEQNFNSLPMAGAIGSRLNSIIQNEESTGAEIDDLVEFGASVKSLAEKPLGRTEEAFNGRSEDVLRIVNDVNPEMGNQLLDMIKNGEDVGPAMSIIAKMPEAKGLIEPGMGWNGRVYSEEEKQGLIEEVKGTANINGSRKAQLIRSISETGEIPDLAAEPKRQPMKYNPRDKNKERY